MKQPNALLRFAVVVGSIVLVGGFVSYRAGAFDEFMAAGSQSGNNSAESSFQQPADSEGEWDPTLMPSTKVGGIFVPARGKTPAKRPTGPKPSNPLP